MYVIGIDFGSLSGRGVLADAATGREIASASMDYPHAVLDRALPCGVPLPADWALQDPQDYLDVLFYILSTLAQAADPAQIVGIGLDCTSSTVLPVDAQGVPLCETVQIGPEPHPLHNAGDFEPDATKHTHANAARIRPSKCCVRASSPSPVRLETWNRGPSGLTPR